jgi:hypothetical protein
MHRAKDDDFTVLLNRAAAGDDGATHAVWEQSYSEMLMVASSMRPTSSADSVHAPSPATILHESFFKTFRPAHANTVIWDSRAHFFGSVSRAMGQFVIDWRRAASRKKRGGGARARVRPGWARGAVRPDRRPDRRARSQQPQPRTRQCPLSLESACAQLRGCRMSSIHGGPLSRGHRSGARDSAADRLQALELRQGAASP